MFDKFRTVRVDTTTVTVIAMVTMIDQDPLTGSTSTPFKLRNCIT